MHTSFIYLLNANRVPLELHVCIEVYVSALRIDVMFDKTEHDGCQSIHGSTVFIDKLKSHKILGCASRGKTHGFNLQRVCSAWILLTASHTPRVAPRRTPTSCSRSVSDLAFP